MQKPVDAIQRALYQCVINKGVADMTHLNALNVRLSNERIRLSNAKTAKEQAQRAVWVRQIEREIAGEIAFMGKVEELPAMTDDELLTELLA